MTYRTQRGAENLAHALVEAAPGTTAIAVLLGSLDNPLWAVRVRTAAGDVGYARPKGKGGLVAAS